MEFVQSCIRVLAAVALFAMGVHFAPAQAAVENDHGAVSAAFDSAHSVGAVTLVELTLAGEVSLARQDCPPVCPTGCPHSPAVDCCGSGVLAVASAAMTVISATAALPHEADHSLSGVEPGALQEPPQLFA